MDSFIIDYYPLFLVITGTLLNLLTFIILCKSTFKDTTARPTIHYMRAIAIFDILMLYGWNLDHFINAKYGFYLQTYSLFSCKLLSFLNYFTSQSSAWLRVFLCLDRYLAMSRLHRTWFSQSKNVLIIITSVITIFLLFNFHFFLFACYYNINGTINTNSTSFTLYPLWSYINLAVYNCIPFILMVIFNSGVIYHLFYLRRTTTVQNSRIQHRSISFTLIITTSLFLIMTMPSNVAFAFFSTANTTVIRVLDALFYTYQITSCPLYFITLVEFRRVCITMFTCKINNRRNQVQPT